MGSAGGTRAVRVLHLSDIHFQGSKSWDARPVLQQLIDFIADIVDREGPPDLVAITGDLAHSGKAAEYRLARAWLDRLWAKLGTPPKDRLLLVPGNHDVDRSKVDFAAEAIQASLLSGRDPQGIATVLGNRGQRSLLLKRHAAYTRFVNEWFGAAQPVPWWRRTIPIDGVQLHVAGLDSAWMACGDQDSTRLLIGRYQLTETVETDEARNAAWRLALVHHPWDDLAAFDRSPSCDTVHRHCDLLLRGHLHRPRPVFIQQPDAALSCLELPTGCAYGGSQWANAFQWIELSPPPEKRVRIRFCLWHEGAWIIDKNRADGWWEVNLVAPPSSSVRARSNRNSRPEVSAEYAAYIRRTFGRIELLGAKEGRAVTLSHVYVPALTRPTTGCAPEQPGDAALLRHSPETEQQAVTLLERIDAESLYVPAPAGAGKTTFCRWAALQCVAGADVSHPVPPPEEFAEPVPAALRGRLAVLVPLRDFSRCMECGRELRWKRADLEQRLVDWICSSPPDGLAGTDLLAHLKAGTALLLLDGLDEVQVTDPRKNVTVYPRTLLLSGLADALPAWRKAGNRILLTSRPYGLEPAQVHMLDLAVAELKPLPQELQALLIRRWFQTLGKEDKVDDVIATVRGREDVQPLAENPMLLTAICVLYDNNGRLPEDRYDLYKSIVGGVLHSRYPGDARERDPVERRLEAVALGMHEGDENHPRQTPAAEVSWQEVERWLARFAQLNPAYETGQVEVGIRREELLNHSGLLLPRADDRAAFYHLSIQEFLAAQRLARSAADVEQVFRDRQGVPEWRATLLFLFAAQIAQRDAQWAMRLLGRLLENQDRATVKSNPVSAAFIAEALDLCVVKRYAVPPDLDRQFRALALQAIDDEVALRSRQAIGLCLGRLGDPRIRSLRDPEAYIEVPAGTYPVGERGEVFQLDAPFRICRYPVTNSQFAEFIKAGGYDEGRRWWSADGWRWLQEQKVAEPRFWRDQRWNGRTQPVVGVSFWEAEACSQWAHGRLPSGQEWELAARGPAGLEYPWGNDWEDGICNSLEARLGVTSPVGLFPRARQAELGIEDLAGNVWEWCESIHARSDETSGSSRGLRGGSWNNNRDNARAASRLVNHPDGRNDLLGFRVVCSSPILDH